MKPLHTAHPYLLSFQQGEQEGFLYFFDLLFPSLCFFAQSLLQDQQEAEDVADEAFLKLWDRRHQFESVEAMQAFLYQVTRNECLNLLKRRKKFRAIQGSLAYSGATQLPSVEQAIIRAETLSQIYQALQELPPRYRQVFTLLYLEGKTTLEAAQELGLTANAVRVQKARALALLRTRLLPHLGGLSLYALLLRFLG